VAQANEEDVSVPALEVAILCAIVVVVFVLIFVGHAD
jgi:hypothetical protein